MTNTLKRYKRNTAIEQIGTEGQIKLLNAKIFVAGAGGLGASVLSNLACLGLKTIGIADYDLVEESNLNRQFIHTPKEIGNYKVKSAKNWIENFNNSIEVETYNIKLSKDNINKVIEGYDIVIDCLDSFDSKFLLNKSCIESNTPLIHGGVQETSGQVMTIIPSKTACLNCLFQGQEEALIPKGIISPIVNIIGSIQAMEAAKLIINPDDPQLLTEGFLSYDVNDHKFKKINFGKNPKCTVCA